MGSPAPQGRGTDPRGSAATGRGALDGDEAPFKWARTPHWPGRGRSIVWSGALGVAEQSFASPQEAPIIGLVSMG